MRCARTLLANTPGLVVADMTDLDVAEHLSRVGPLLRAGSGCNCDLGEELTQVLTVGPLNAGIAKLQADNALKTAQRVCTDKGWPSSELHNGKADAFRHCYWSCLMMKAMGLFTAKLIGDTHECCSASPEQERAMDLHNNMVGRTLGGGLRVITGDCEIDCLKALELGQLISRVGALPTRPIKGY